MKKVVNCLDSFSAAAEVERASVAERIGAGVRPN